MRTHQQFAPKEEVEVDQSTPIQNVQKKTTNNKINLHHTQQESDQIPFLLYIQFALFHCSRVCTIFIFNFQIL